MNVRECWSDSDFSDMGWHDSRLYVVALPNEEFKLALNIDYIFKWEKLPDSATEFWVSPCDLIFNNVSNFKMDVDFKDTNLLFISDIKRTNKKLTPNKKFTDWDYEIECDNGVISFSATGFEQRVRKQPVLSASQDLDK